MIPALSGRLPAHPLTEIADKCPTGQTGRVHTERGFTRLVTFSDGVVAIAITLLILPLVTSASETDLDLAAYLAANVFQLLVFVISFAVIGRFWFVHHQLYEHAIDYNGPLIWANLLWLATIVFLPFPTELLAAADTPNPLAYGLYIGTMIATSSSALLQQWILVSNPELQSPEARGSLRLLPYISVSVLLVAALLVAVLVPQIGLWSLVLLAVSGPLERLVDRRRTRRTTG